MFDNQALLEFITSGKVKNGHFDMLSSDGRNLITSQKGMRYYEHTAWEYNQPKAGGQLGGYVNIEYADNLKKVIDSCLNNEVEFAHLNRINNLWF